MPPTIAIDVDDDVATNMDAAPTRTVDLTAADSSKIASGTIIVLDAEEDAIDLTHSSAASSNLSELFSLYEKVSLTSASHATIDVEEVVTTDDAAPPPRQLGASSAAASGATSASGTRAVVDLASDDDSEVRGKADRPAGKRRALATKPRNAASTTQPDTRRRIRVDVCGVLTLSLRLEARCPLIYLYQIEAVQQALHSRWRAGTHPPTDVLQLARHFNLVSGSRRIDSIECLSTTCAAVDASVRIERASHLQFATPRDATIGGIDAVEIVRFDFAPPPKQFAQFHQVVGARIAGMSGGFHGSSPILLIKNFNQDRGLGLFKAIYAGQGHGLHQAHYGSHLPSNANPPIHRAADRVLDMCEAAMLKHGNQRACAALMQRTAYNMTVARAYKQGANELPHHVDGLGGWVVLFSFGATVDFFVGHKTLCIESGDALVFNGAPAHGVVHGFTHAVRKHATCRGKTMSLVGMSQIDGMRLSVQARQQ